MKIKKKILLLITIIVILTGINSIAMADPIPPKPIRDSIIEEI